MAESKKPTKRKKQQGASPAATPAPTPTPEKPKAAPAKAAAPAKVKAPAKAKAPVATKGAVPTPASSKEITAPQAPVKAAPAKSSAPVKPAPAKVPAPVKAAPAKAPAPTPAPAKPKAAKKKTTTAPASSEKAKGTSAKNDRPSVQRKRRRWPVVVILSLLAVVLAVGGIFSWDRWLRYDDEADMQGQWVVPGTQQTVNIVNGEIAINDEVGYPYNLDTQNKTIEYVFGNLSGFGRYQFSEDRQTLVIFEGEESNILADIASKYDQIINGVDLRSTTSKTPVTILTKAPA